MSVEVLSQCWGATSLSASYAFVQQNESKPMACNWLEMIGFRGLFIDPPLPICTANPLSASVCEPCFGRAYV